VSSSEMFSHGLLFMDVLVGTLYILSVIVRWHPSVHCPQLQPAYVITVMTFPSRCRI